MPGLILALLGYAIVTAVVGPRLLRTCRRVQVRVPRFGLALWMVAITSWVVAVLSAGLAAIAQLTDGHGLAALLHACLRAITVLIAPHDLAELAASVAFLGSVLFSGRLLTIAINHARQARRHRRDHCAELCRTNEDRPRPRQRITVVHCAEPTAYCVPGPEHTIIVTTGTLARLTHDELRAVLAHETSHLSGRHHLWLGWASVLARAFGFVPLLKAAPNEVAQLIEWVADDRAAREHGDRTVARALAVMATNGDADPPGYAGASRRSNRRTPSSNVALTATGSGVPERVRRLLDRYPVARLAYGRGVLAMSVGLLALVTAAAVLVPAATADPRPLCTAPPSLSDILP